MVWHSMMERLATSLSCHAMPRYACVRTVVVVRALDSRQKAGVGHSSMVWHSVMERLATSLSCYAMSRYACAQMVVVVRGWVVKMSCMVSDTRRLVEEIGPSQTEQ